MSTQRKTRIVLTVLVVLILIGNVTGCSSESKNEQRTSTSIVQEIEDKGAINLTFLTTDSSSSYYAYSAAVAKAINKMVPSVHITVVESGGSVENIRLVSQGQKGDLLIGDTRAAYFGYKGEDFAEGQPLDSLRIGWLFSPAPFNWFVGQDTGIEKFDELSGSKFGPGGIGTTTELVTAEVFDLLGIKIDTFKGSISDEQAAYTDRTIVGATKAGKAPDSYLQQVHVSRPIKILSFTSEQMKEITGKFPYLTPAEIPDEGYQGVKGAKTVQVAMSVELTSDVPQQIGYEILKALLSDEGLSTWGAAYSAGVDVDVPRLTVEASAIPLHAGTVQFLKEQGIEVPENLVPQEYQ